MSTADSITTHETAAQEPSLAPLSTALAPASIDPTMALDLRLRWLEAIVLGMKHNGGMRIKDGHGLSHNGETLYRIVESIQRRLDAIVEGNEGLKMFMNQCINLPLFLLPPIQPRAFSA